MHKFLIQMELANNERVDIMLFDPQEDSTKTQNNRLPNIAFFVAMSPDPENCKKLVKTPQPQRSKGSLYMGTHSLPEAEAIQTVCYEDIPPAVLSTRYEVISISISNN